MHETKASADLLKECLSYDPETGVICRTKHKFSTFIGRRADTCLRKGYRCVTVRRIPYSAHRVAWLLYHGRWPEVEIDHVNMVCDDNRIANLRPATRSQNQANTRPRGEFMKGVTLHKCGKYQSQIKVNGSNIYLGLFDDELSAHGAYLSAAKIHFGEFARAA